MGLYQPWCGVVPRGSMVAENASTCGTARRPPFVAVYLFDDYFCINPSTTNYALNLFTSTRRGEAPTNICNEHLKTRDDELRSPCIGTLLAFGLVTWLHRR
jgi:hypothetical protein